MFPVRTRPPVAPDTEEPAPAEAFASEAPRPRGDRRWLAAAVLFALVGLPFVVAAVTLRRPQWYPVLDLAMTELRLRDVGTGHTPLIGLPGRIGPSLMEQGSHPGPLSFYLLAPFYRAFGSSSWAMQAGTVVLNLAAVGAALGIAARRGGTRLVGTVGVVLALLCLGYGLTALTQPWNPYLPLLWWFVFLLAVWSVVCDDLAMLPVAVVAGSLCGQTHVPYLGLAVGLGALAAVATLRAWRRADPGSDGRRRAARWGAAALVVGAALWVPPLVDQATNDPGNIRALYDHLLTPAGPDEPVGFARGAELALRHLDLAGLVGQARTDGTLLDASANTTGSLVPGALLLAVWIAAALAARRLGPPALVRLHLVVASGLALGVLSMARILGKEWYYLMLWAWGVTALLVVSVAWTAAVVAGRRPEPERRRAAAVAGGAALAVTVVSVALSVAAAISVDPPEAHLSSTLGRVASPTVAALERGEGAATGQDGRYQVTWDDAYYFGSQGFGLVSELERAGFDAGLSETFHVPITDHRVIDAEDATATVHLVTGRYIEPWRALPEAVEVAYVEPRDDAERAEFAGLRAEVIDDLQGEGLDDLVPMVDDNLFGLSIDERISDRAQRWTARMLRLGEPTAVFVTPPGVEL
jgi:hypothetical protein